MGSDGASSGAPSLLGLDVEMLLCCGDTTYQYGSGLWPLAIAMNCP
jgi:hypothetical protein